MMCTYGAFVMRDWVIELSRRWCSIPVVGNTSMVFTPGELSAPESVLQVAQLGDVFKT